MAGFIEREINHLNIYKYLWRSSWRPSLRFGKVAKCAKTAMLFSLAIFPASTKPPRALAVLPRSGSTQGTQYPIFSPYEGRN